MGVPGTGGEHAGTDKFIFEINAIALAYHGGHRMEVVLLDDRLAHDCCAGAFDAQSMQDGAVGWDSNPHCLLGRGRRRPAVRRRPQGWVPGLVHVSSSS